MQVRSQLGRTIETLEATEGHVLANLANQPLANVFQCRTKTILLVSQSAQTSHIGWVVLCHEGCRRIGQSQETVILGYKVGFAIYFNQGARGTFDTGSHNALSGHARSGLASLAAKLDAQQLFCFHHVAFSFGQSFLAFHHGRIGLAAQFCHHACCNCCHLDSP